MTAITTAAELDALLMAVSESAEAAIITQCRRPYLITEDDCGDYWAWSYQIEDEDLPYVSAETLALPWVVIYHPDQPQRTESPIRAGALREVAKSAVLMEVGRKAVEDELIEWRDSRRFSLRRNGYVIRESDGSASDIVRFGPEFGCRIALEAMADRIESDARP